MKIDIIVAHIPRDPSGHEVNFVPPFSGIHLAALTPPAHRVRVIHQQIAEPQPDTDADLIAITFFRDFAPTAYQLARRYRQQGKLVVGSGTHLTFAAHEATAFFDAIIVGLGESVWVSLLGDAMNGSLQTVYLGRPLPWDEIPTPCGDLRHPQVSLPRLVQATQGCAVARSCRTVPTLIPSLRTNHVTIADAEIRATLSTQKHHSQRAARQLVEQEVA